MDYIGIESQIFMNESRTAMALDNGVDFVKDVFCDFKWIMVVHIRF